MKDWNLHKWYTEVLSTLFNLALRQVGMGKADKIACKSICKKLWQMDVWSFSTFGVA